MSSYFRSTCRAASELLLFISVDVRSLTLRETVHKDRALTLLEKNDRAYPPDLPAPAAPLLDDPAAKVGIYLSFFRASYASN